MKATPSKDGCLRFTLLIRVRAGRVDLIDSICWAVDRGRCTFDGIRNRVDVINIAKEAMGHGGAALWRITEEVPDDMRDRATNLVNKLFPELTKV